MSKNLDFRLLIIDDHPEARQDFLKTLGSGKIDTVRRSTEALSMIKRALSKGRPYALVFANLHTVSSQDELQWMQELWQLDPDVQIAICMEYSDAVWEKIASNFQHENLLLIKKPFDLIAVRQLSYALVKKWQLIKKSEEYSALLEESVKDRTKLLEYQATHDLLTGLPNRTLLMERIDAAIKLAKSENGKFGVLVFDLDRFKIVNDTFSYTMGDELLQRIAKRIQFATRKSDTIARVSGDEFIAVFVLIQDDESLIIIANKILDALKKPFKIMDTEVTVTVSVGVSVYPRDGLLADELLRNADIAMYRAKEKGENQLEFYSPRVKDHTLKDLEMGTDLHRAVIGNEFFLCYQPEVSTQNGDIISAEALIRWLHPKKGLIMPNDFIPIAEEVGVIVPIGTWVLREACMQNKKWQDAGLPHIRMAVNISPRQFKQANFFEVVKNILNETGLKGEYLELELTENLLMKVEDAQAILLELKKLGVSIALDDFGSGYSSLGYLRRMPIDRLKIDQSYVQNINLENDDEIIIKAILSMAESLKLNVVAEGVETQDQLDFLRGKNCEEMQGFLFSKPIPAEEMEALLRKQGKLD